MKRPVRVESAKSEVRVAVARALATALMTGLDNAAEDGHALSQVQAISVATMHVMAYDATLSACANLDFEADVLS